MSIAENLETIAENVPKVYEAGHAKGVLDFQSMLSRNGERTTWTSVFQGSDFSGFTFNPPIYPTKLGSVFYNYSGAEFPKGVDFSNAIIAETNTGTADIPYQMFAYCRRQERIPDMNIPVQYYYTYTFRNCYAKKIDIIRVVENTQYSNTFSGCDYLEEVTFEGTIGNSINFSACPLSVESLKNIISCLKDYTGSSEYSYTITLKSSAFAALESEWADLIDDKKWNLTLA